MPVKVAQWATGTVGSRALRAAIGHPDLEVVAVLVHDPAKAGKDAGELCGLDPIGVVATTEVDELMAATPDCVLHAPLVRDLQATREQIQTLLRNGVNVVTTADASAMHPPSLAAEVRAAYEEACVQGNATLRAAGLSPGFANELIPILASGVCGRIQHVRVSEYANLAHYESAAISDQLGWGKDPSYAVPTDMLTRLDAAFVAPLRILATCLGVEVDQIEITREQAIATHDYEIRTGIIGAGTIAGWRFRYDGLVNGDLVASIDTAWRTHDQYGRGPDWFVGEAWDVVITGEPDLRLHWEVGAPVPPGATSESRSSERMTSAGTHLANAAPAVLAAPSGIMTLADLGLARGRWQRPAPTV